MALLTQEDFKKPPQPKRELKRTSLAVSVDTDKMLSRLAHPCDVTPAAYLRKLIDTEATASFLTEDDIAYAAKEYESAAEKVTRVHTLHPRHDRVIKDLAYKYDVRRGLVIAALIQAAGLEAGLDGGA